MIKSCFLFLRFCMKEKREKSFVSLTNRVKRGRRPSCVWVSSCQTTLVATAPPSVSPLGIEPRPQQDSTTTTMLRATFTPKRRWLYSRLCCYITGVCVRACMRTGFFDLTDATNSFIFSFKLACLLKVLWGNLTGISYSFSSLICRNGRCRTGGAIS